MSKDSKAVIEALKPQLEHFTNYACSDAISFLGQVCCVRKNADGELKRFKPTNLNDEVLHEKLMEEVINRVQSQSDFDKLFEVGSGSYAMGSALSYTAEDIQKHALTINSVKSGICTTFALAGANLMLELSKQDEYKELIQRVEIVGRFAGHSASHCFAVINRAPGSSLDEPQTWGPDAVIVDPWLASLQNPVMYTIPEFEMTGFLEGQLEVNFDTLTPNLAQLKAQEKEQRVALRHALRESILDEDLPELDKRIKESGKEMTSIKLSVGSEDLISYAISNNKLRSVNHLLQQVDPNDFTQKSEVWLRAAIESNNLELFKLLINKGAPTTSSDLLLLSLDIAISTGNIQYFSTMLEAQSKTLPNQDCFEDALSKLIEYKNKHAALISPYLSKFPYDVIESFCDNLDSNIAVYMEAKKEMHKINEKVKKFRENEQKKQDDLQKNQDGLKKSKPLLLTPVLIKGAIPEPPQPPPMNFFKPKGAKADLKTVQDKERIQLNNLVNELASYILEYTGLDIKTSELMQIETRLDHSMILSTNLVDYLFQYTDVENAEVDPAEFDSHLLEKEVSDMLHELKLSITRGEMFLSNVLKDPNGLKFHELSEKEQSEQIKLITKFDERIEHIIAIREQHKPSNAPNKLSKALDASFETQIGAIKEKNQRLKTIAPRLSTEFTIEKSRLKPR